MKTALILLIFLNLNWLYSQNIFDEYKNQQNADGSFGDKNKELVTSMVVLAFMNEGIVTSDRNYGGTVKKGVKYLSSCVDEVKKNPTDMKFIYLTWALSSSYCMTGVSLLEEDCNDLLKVFYEQVRREKSWNFTGFTSKEKIIPLAFAASSMYSAGLGGDKLNEMMKAYAVQIREGDRFNEDTNFLIEVIKLMWDIKELPKAKSLNLKPEILAKFIAGLNSESSKVRKHTFNKCLYLKPGELLSLMNELENSAIVELNLVAKDLKNKEKFPKIDYMKILESSTSSASLLYLGSCYSNIDGYDAFKLYSAGTLNKFIGRDGQISLKKNLPMTAVCSELSAKENRIVNSAYFVLLFSSNDYQGFKQKFRTVQREKVKMRMPLDDFDEEGLDLVD